jgi:mRNA-degrading endonuclease RelE of RelBE toxin-antitoxin system
MVQEDRPEIHCRGLEVKLQHEHAVETRNRKRLRRNDLAEWELRVGQFRVFYDVDLNDRVIKIETIGYKRGGHLYIRVKEYRF